MSFHISPSYHGNVGLVYPLEMGRKRTMKFAFFAFLVFLGGAIFLLSFVADRQAKLGDDRVARKMSLSVIDARFVSEHSPYMRNER